MKGVIFVIWSFCWAIVQADRATERILHAAATQEKNRVLVLNFIRDFFVERNERKLNIYIDDGPENYIQHNPFLADGREALRKASRIWFKSGDFKVDVKRVAADGDLVFVHSVYTGTGPENQSRAAVDILRVKDNKIVEHWDVSQEIPDVTVSGHPMV